MLGGPGSLVLLVLLVHVCECDGSGLAGRDRATVEESASEGLCGRGGREARTVTIVATHERLRSVIVAAACPLLLSRVVLLRVRRDPTAMCSESAGGYVSCAR